MSVLTWISADRSFVASGRDPHGKLKVFFNNTWHTPHIRPFQPRPTRIFPKTLTRTDLPDFETWAKLVRLAQSQLPKVVLARRTRLTLDAVPDLNIFLRHVPPSLTGVMIEMPRETFLSITPETLYRRRGSTITVEALAGTALLHGPSPMLCAKTVREFEMVPPSFPLPLHWGPLHVRTTPTLQHLCRLGTGTTTLTDEELIALLHPSAAIVGAPRHAALDFLQRHEPFDRALYASPIGWSTSEEAHVVIGIRSLICRGTEVDLFAGAGITSESDPHAEWEELNQKIQWHSRMQSQ